MNSKFILGETLVSGAELDTRAARAATGLRDNGIGPGDTVAWLLRNDIAIFEAVAAIQRVGATVIPVNWHFSAEEIVYVLKDSGAKAIVVHADLFARIEKELPPGILALVVPTPEAIQTAYKIDRELCIPPAGAAIWPTWLAAFEPRREPPPRAPTRMLYTSGTTGRPKGVKREPPSEEQTHRLQARARTVMGHHPGMRTIVCCPAYHAAPNSYAGLAVAFGATIVLQPRFDAEELLALIERHRITGMFMAPIMFVRLLRLPDDIRRRYDLSSLQHIIHAGATCPPNVKRGMIEWWGPIIHEFYGSTESGLITHCNSEQALSHPGTAGKPTETSTLRIYRDDGSEAALNEPGEIYMISADNPEFTYHNDPEKRRAIDRDGLITNGDVGYLDEDGFLYICDRVKDMVISGGVNIYPAEIEAAILDFPGVRDCAVFGIPDDEFGEAVAALVEPVGGGTVVEADLRAHLAKHLAKFKVPWLIEFRHDLPREDTGKIFKRKLREPYWVDAGRRI
jgi:long-chain acyl-CoA synthetase